MKQIALILVAAGRGSRAGGNVPKQWQVVGGKTLAAHALAAFQASGLVTQAIAVVHEDDHEAAKALGIPVVFGGASRAQSVRAGLEALAAQDLPPDLVLIHDAARPGVSPSMIARVVAALETHQGAAPGLPVVDALWRVQDGKIAASTPRDGLARAQTPQGFHFAPILAAHRGTGRTEAADDVELAIRAGIEIALVAGEEAAFKVTHPEDLARARRIFESRTMRIGNGYDIHRLVKGDHVTLGGHKIACEFGVEAHSDGDVVLHAACDAIYGALGAGDIGRHFPPSEGEWKGADSRIFLAHAVALAAAKGYVVGNLDVTVLAERPKIAPHAAAMRAQMAALLGVAPDCVSLKATTTEGLDAIGRGEGIAAQAAVLLVAA